MVRKLQQMVIQSKKDLKQINKSYITVQAENTAMRTQLKTASCSARLKQCQYDLKQSQDKVADLKKQLRRSQKEVDQLKNGSQNLYQKDIPHSAYALPVTECRRLLQSISNIVYSDTECPPDLTRLPQLVLSMKDTEKQVQLLSMMGISNDQNQQITSRSEIEPIAQQFANNNYVAENDNNNDHSLSLSQPQQIPLSSASWSANDQFHPEPVSGVG